MAMNALVVQVLVLTVLLSILFNNQISVYVYLLYVRYLFVEVLDFIIRRFVL